MEPLTALQSWKDLGLLAETVKPLHLRDLFASDPGRASRFSLEAEGILLDYSKNRITAETMTALLRLADESNLRKAVDAMFRGDRINLTENRSVLHTALRSPRGQQLVVDGGDVVAQVHEVLE